MPVSNNHDFIFIHIPKTAGTSIERCLLQNNLINVGKKWLQGKIDSQEFEQYNYSNRYWHHLNSYEVKQIIGQEKWSKYFKFAFVRNPWDRAVSFYFYMKESVENPNSLSFGKTYPNTFEDWVKKGNLPPDQQSQITNEEGKIMVDFVGRFENLVDDFNFVSTQIKFTQLKLDHFKKTSRKNYKQYYDKEEIRQIITNKYRKDIDLFKYKF